MALILSEYFKIFNEYSIRYGKNVAVLMQVGSFYEMYGVSNDYDKRGNAEELSRILNIVLTRRNKKVQGNSLNNPLMLGFPCPALSKYILVLLDEGYTVVVVDQVKASPIDSSIKRAVVDVVSPSINMLNTSFNDNYLVLIYIDAHMHIGMSAISVITGKSVVYECYSYSDDKNRSLDDALGFLKQYMPKEVVISGKYNTNIVSYFELDDITCHLNTVSNLKRLNTEYCESVLNLVFTKKPRTLLSNIELLGLERMSNALFSYVMLIEFVYDHNPMLLRKMLLPDIFSATSRLVLSTSTVEQLNVAGCKKHTLFNVVNKCSTNAGKRLLMTRILAPSVDVNEIMERYDQVDTFGTLFGDKVEHVNMVLKKIVDIERLQRRMLIGIITPGELASLCLSYEAVLELYNLLGSVGASAEVFTKVLHGCNNIIEEFVGMCRYVFDVDSMFTSEPCLNDNVCDKIDKLKGLIRSQMDIIENVALNIGIKSPKIEYNNTTGHYISVTCSQAKAIKDKTVVIKYNSASCKVTSPVIDTASKIIVSLLVALKERTQKVYKYTLECLLSYSKIFERIVGFISNIDLVKSSFVTSNMYNYCRPIIAKEGSSFVDAKDLRHPIIERIDNGNEYVPNDITVGKEHNGIVLYSMNSCGKTSLMRALGLSVILAQAGLFVPASSFTLCPFKCMMTRILSKDNIMKGQSSFVAEMSELRAILKRATSPSTLVLADEITHGTEHTSGSSIFISSVEMLAKRRVNFLFTTHLHSVYPFVKDIPNVGIFHLSVYINNAQNARKILFERKLKPGPGGSIYGLEVCDFLGMDDDFLARAFKIRNMITFDESLKAKPRPSKYNNKKMVQCCEECGYYPRLPTDNRLDTHHIKHQSIADKNGMINGMHKNALSNLKILCKQCHAKEHQHIKTTV